MDTTDQLELLPLKERIETGVEAAYEQHGYSTDGGIDRVALEDKVFALVSVAVVEKRADRAKLAVTRRSLMSSAFGQIPGPEAWAEQDDPEQAAGIYSTLDGILWRLVSDDENGKIQSRLNGEAGLILCRTKATPDKADAVYVTRDIQCLLADWSAPQKVRIEKQAKRMAKNLAMAVERQPAHAKRLNQELLGAMKTALGTSQAILAPALEAAKIDTAGEDDEPDVDA
jgi:hypothetical protein